jgi:hypothetical protein
MRLALPPAISVGETVTAPVVPPRTYYRRPVCVTGRVTGIDPGTGALTLNTPEGYQTVAYAAARRARAS